MCLAGAVGMAHTGSAGSVATPMDRAEQMCDWPVRRWWCIQVVQCLWPPPMDRAEYMFAKPVQYRWCGQVVRVPLTSSIDRAEQICAMSVQQGWYGRAVRAQWPPPPPWTVWSRCVLDRCGRDGMDVYQRQDAGLCA